jgi:iron complex outermembrane receptor protein
VASLSLCCALTAAPAAVAAEARPQSAAELASLSLDALLDLQVSGASKFSQRMSETAASVTVIGSSEIRALGYRTLADVLRSVRGLMVADDRSYSYLGVRGFFVPGDYTTRVLLLIDGNRVNDNVYDQAYLGSEFPVDLDLVDRVEFIPGQGSAVYGANALFGVVNVITRHGADAGAANVSLTMDSDSGARQLRMGDARRWADGTALRWSASRRLAPGEAIGGAGRAVDRERRSSLYLRAEHGAWTASVIHAERIKGTPFLLESMEGDTRQYNRDEHSMLDLSWRQAIDAHDELSARWFIGHYLFQGQYVFDNPPPTANQDQVTGQWWGIEARWFTTRWSGHKLVAGTELQQSTHLRQKNVDVEPAAATYLDDSRDAHRMGVFAEDQWELSPRWSLTAGARWDHVSQFATQFSPRLALHWRAQDELVFKLIHGSAYRPPNAYEAYYHVDTVGGYKLNPALRGEAVRGTELAMEWHPGARDRVSASLYRNDARHLIELTRDPADDLFVFQNIGGARTQGLELEYEVLWHGGARLRGNLSLARASDSGAAQPVAIYAPHRMGKLMGIQPLGARWNLGAEWQGVSRRGAAPGYGVANLTLSRDLPAHGLSFAASVYDLFDRRRLDPGVDVVAQPTIPQAGRSLRLRLDYVL